MSLEIFATLIIAWFFIVNGVMIYLLFKNKKKGRK